MFDYFQEFNKLPKDIRDKVSSPKVMADIDSLERKYKVELASFVMKTMTRKIPVNSLALYLTSLLKVRREVALNLERELLDKVFFDVRDYLNNTKKDGVTRKEESNVIEKDNINEKGEVKDFVKDVKKENEEKTDIFEKKEKKPDVFNNNVSKNVLDNSFSYKKNTKIDEPKNVIKETEKAKSFFDDLLKNKNQSRPEITSKPEVKQKSLGNRQGENNNTINRKDIYNVQANRPFNKVVEKDGEKLDSVKAKVDRVIKEINISLSSSHLMSRFEFILTMYIKGVRDKVSTRSALSRNPNEGGLGLDQITIDKIFSIVNSFSKEDRKQSSSVFEEEKKKLDSLNDTYDFRKVIAEKEKQLEAGQEEKLLDTSKDLEKVVPKLSPPPPAIIKNNQGSENKGQIKPGIASGGLNKENLPGIKLDSVLDQGEKKNEEDKKVEENKIDINKINEHKKDENKKDEKSDNLVFQKKEENKKKFSLFHSKKNKNEGNKDEKKALVGDKDEKVPLAGIEKIDSLIKKEGKKISEGVEKNKSEFNKVFEDKSAEKEIINFDSEKIKRENNRVKFNPKPNTNKPRLDDIKVVDRIMGPIDELKNIDLVDFRRLGKTCDDRVNKIKDKLNLLEEDSYDKMILGIEAWRKNPLNILYRNITIDSINKSLPIKDVIDQREKNGQDTLSLEELQSLIAFNREITF